MERFSEPHVLAEIDRLTGELAHATKSIGYLTDTLAAIRDIAYCAGDGPAAKDALDAIRSRAARAVGGGS
jgi:hypothetical protein